MTGASGHFGREALKQTLEIENVEFVRVFLTNKRRNDRLAKKLIKKSRQNTDRARLGDNHI